MERFLAQQMMRVLQEGVQGIVAVASDFLISMLPVAVKSGNQCKIVTSRLLCPDF